MTQICDFRLFQKKNTDFKYYVFYTIEMICDFEIVLYLCFTACRFLSNLHTLKFADSRRPISPKRGTTDSYHSNT